MRIVEFVIGMLGLGLSIPRIATRTAGSENSAVNTAGQPIGLLLVLTKAS